jgi:hypothetical protein
MTASDRSAKKATPPTTPPMIGPIIVESCGDEEAEWVEEGVKEEAAVGCGPAVDSGPSDTLLSRPNGEIGKGCT